jgi:hypothetical protein
MEKPRKSQEKIVPAVLEPPVESFIMPKISRIGTVASRFIKTKVISNIPTRPQLENREYMQVPIPSAFITEWIDVTKFSIEGSPNQPLKISQVIVLNEQGENVAFEKPVSLKAGVAAGGTLSNIVNGTMSGSPFWSSTTAPAKIEVDLQGSNRVFYVVCINAPGAQISLLNRGVNTVITPPVLISERFQNEPYHIISASRQSTAARYVVIRPPVKDGDGFLKLGQVQVYDNQNLMLHKSGGREVTTYAYRANAAPSFSDDGYRFTLPSSADPMATKVISGTLQEPWTSATNLRNLDFWAADLGGDRDVSTIGLFGNLSAGDPLPLKGVRVELYDSGGNKVNAFVIQSDEQMQILSALSSSEQVSYNKGASVFDAFYDAYQEQQYEEPFDIDLEITREPIPDWGYQLKNFDASISEIPWDTDNKDFIKGDVTWGYISPLASMSIYSKIYTQSVAAEEAYIDNETSMPTYKSPIFNRCVYDEGWGNFYSYLDMSVAALIGEETENILEYGAKRVANTMRDSMRTGRLNTILGGVQSIDDFVWGKLPDSKLKNKLGEKLAIGKVKFEGVVTTGLKKLGTKIANATGLKKLAKSISSALVKLSARIAAKQVARIALWSSIRAGMYAVSGALTTAATGICAATLGIGCAAVAWMFYIAMVIISILGTIDMIIMILTPVINAFISGAAEENGVCPVGSETIEQRLGSEFKYILVNFIPGVGTIFDILDPYFCFQGATLIPRVPLKQPTYRYDKTLSLYHRDFEPALEPRASSEKDPGFILPDNIDELKWRYGIEYCDYASSTMLDRMIQFYNENARMKPSVLDDGRIEYKVINKIKGVVASSELSADVRCTMTSLRHDPITGENLEAIEGCSYPDDEVMNGVTDCFRRFYFVKTREDPNGVFTVTGCTHEDYTALDAMVSSFETGEGTPYVPGIPKIFVAADKKGKRGYWDKVGDYFTKGGFVDAALANWVPLGAGKAGGSLTSKLFKKDPLTKEMSYFGRLGTQFGGVQAGVGAGFGAQQLTSSDAWNRTWGREQQQVETDYYINKERKGDREYFTLIANTPDYLINYGPITEDAEGYEPNYNPCSVMKTYNSFCADKTIVQGFVEGYQTQYPKHVKEIIGIEPRGADGCYYKFKEVDYNAETNVEGTTETVNDVVMTMQQADDLTCVMTPTGFTRDFAKYPIRVIKDYNYMEEKRAADKVNPNDKIRDMTTKPAPGQCLDNIKTVGEIRQQILSSGVSATFYPTRQQRLNPNTDEPAIGNISEAEALALPFRYPKKPFRVPQYVAQTTLGGRICPTKCTDKAIIDSLVGSFNNRYFDRQIMNVMKGITPTETRCDYEVQMMRMVDDKRVMGTETIAFTLKQVDSPSKCLFEYVSDTSDTPNQGNFIIKWDKENYGYDIDGGIDNFDKKFYAIEGATTDSAKIPYFTKMMDDFKGAYTSLLNAVASATTSQGTNIKAPLENTHKAYLNIEGKVGVSTGFPNCPEVTCQSPMMLQKMKVAYEAKNNITGSSGRKKTMTRFIAAVKSAPTTCELLYETESNIYSDILSSPTDTSKSIEVSEFKFTDEGGCKFNILANDVVTKVDKMATSEAEADIIYNINPAFQEEGSKIVMTDRVASCLNTECRNSSILSQIKAKLEASWGNNINKQEKLSTITASLQTGQMECEYAITKNLLVLNADEENINSYLKVGLTSSTGSDNACRYNVDTVTEYDPATINLDYDNRTGKYKAYKNSQEIALPLLFFYDPTDTNRKYNPKIDRSITRIAV